MMKRCIVLGIMLCLMGSSAWSMKRLASLNETWASQEKKVKHSQELLTLGKKGSLQSIKSLLAHGADPNVADEKGSVLHYACFNGEYAFVELLLDAGAQVEARDSEDWTPLHAAAYHGHKRVSRLLISRKAQVDARTVVGYTPLYVAVETGHKGVCELLIGRGAQVNARLNPAYVHNDVPFGGFTPLHSAVHCNKLEIVKFLMLAGADKHARTQDGRTVIDIASQRKHSELVTYLEKELSAADSLKPAVEEEASYNLLSAVGQDNNKRVVQLLETNVYTVEEVHAAFTKAREIGNHYLVGWMINEGLIPLAAPYDRLVEKVPTS